MDRLTRIAQVAAQGNAKALQALVEASYPEVWRLCAALVDQDAADDLAQETFLRATRAIRRFRGGASARTWILAIARNTCMDELRARTRRRRRDTLVAARTSADTLTAQDPAESSDAYHLLKDLDDDRRAAFVLTQLFRLSYEEAATVCGCPTGTIRSRVARARDELVARLEEDSSQAQTRRIPQG
jgi:RNA polymerase sigma-70 factor (ECF subfamily)